MSGREENNCEPRQRIDRPNIERIAKLNDELRQWGDHGFILSTPGLKALPGFDAEEVIDLLIAYDDFNADNDPHGERDFGSFQYLGEKLFWKIDYYDVSLRFASPDASDRKRTERVLTIMLASEY